VSERPADLLSRWRASIDLRLSSVPSGAEQLPARLRDAIHYSLTGGGKRLRGLLLMASYHSLGGQGDASGLGASVEVVHAYSLIHDDLPCMDNDTIRRGRPTTHLAFDVATATAAGVVMVPIAVRQTITAGSELGLDAAVIQRLVRVLMAASGASGMVGGQLLDLEGEGQSLSVSDLERIHRAKTGALIAATFTMGGIAAGGSERAIDALTAAGTSLGLAFQIADDVLDATESSEALGKTAGADAALAKSTYASVLGIPAARARSQALVREAMTVLEKANLRAEPLEQLAHFVSARRS
jgi:geranylgeranyl diphosphate synthase, type II